MDHYIAALYAIVTKGLNTNSYKCALWRALASLAPGTDQKKLNISKQQLAPLFLSYYWPLEVKYHIRQGIDPNKDPIVMKRIRHLIGVGTIAHGETLKDFHQRMPTQHKMLVGSIARQAFDDVIPRFHIVHGKQVDPTIFTFTGKPGKAGDAIELTDGGRRFLIDYHVLIDYVAVSGWVRFTEQFTSAPRLHDKIADTRVKRGAVTQWCELLRVMQNGKCFYDETHDMASSEVDHLLPWSFVLEDKTWNLVLACRKCKNGQRDRLTSKVALGRLGARNEKSAKNQIDLDQKFLRYFVEWHSRNLSSHIQGLYDQAVADKFPTWK